MARKAQSPKAQAAKRPELKAGNAPGALAGLLRGGLGALRGLGGRPHFRNLLPPLAFLLALCLLVVCFYDAGYTALPPTGKRYDTAKAGIETLRLDEKRAGQREPWEKLAEEFRSIYDADPGWPNRPAALFRAAESLEELARRSFARADARKAIECYESVALRHADSRLADDALFRAAKLRAAWLKDDKGALELLARIKSQYPRGDMLPEALALEKTLEASARGRTAPEAKQVAATDAKKADEDVPAPKPAAVETLPQEQVLPRYRSAKARMEALRADKVRSCWRQPWEELQEEFLRIYRSRKGWAISPGALYRAAASQEALADCSRLADEYRTARDTYLHLAQEFPRSALADDALFRAAGIEADRLNQPGEALELLDAIAALYPQGDMLSKARDMRGRLAGSNTANNTADNIAPAAGAAPSEPPEVLMLSWNSLSKDSVEIVLELSGPARYSARLVREGKSRKGASSLLLELENASVAQDVRKGLKVNGSLLQSVLVRDRKGGGAVMQFAFREVRRFDAEAASDPNRIVLRVAAGKAALPPSSDARAGFAENEGARDATARPPVRHVNDMARQLGLEARTVFIDAGHGGKDPGTSHNNILERAVTLDVALTLGRLLQANGLQVMYSRTGDTGLPLSERTARANAAGADIFVSIHVNANNDRSVNGFETYYLELADTPDAARVAALENAGSDHRLGDMQRVLAYVMLNARTEESRRLAADIQRLTIFRLKRRAYDTRDNGVKSAPFHVLLGAQMPAVLVELGYCTHSAEARNLADPKYRMALAEGLAEGLLAYKDRLQKRRTARNSLTPESADAM